MLITNGTILTMDADAPLIRSAALYVEQGRIVDIGPNDQISARHLNRIRGDSVLDASNKIVMPGLICAHTHFYGAFARGMAIPGEPPADFAQILRRLWWRLDKALDEQSIYLSAMVCLIDAIRHGTTTLIDHHASPNAIDGSLDVIADAVLQAGVRASLCYEVTDRDGPGRAREGIRENERFVKKMGKSANGQIDKSGKEKTDTCGNHDYPTSQPPNMLGALFGLHASMTLSEKTLETCAGVAVDLGVGCHIHVAEGQADVQDSLRKYRCRVVERLEKAGILGSKTLAAHCVHVDQREKDLLARTRTCVAHNPRSNMNNAVGIADVLAMFHRGITVGLGNDGFSNNMFTEMNTTYLLHKHAEIDPRVMSADQVLHMVFSHNAQIAARAGLPENLGTLRVGAPADLIIVNYHPTTPLTQHNVPWHILFGIDGTNVETTVVGGKVLMKDGQLLTLDEAEITSRSRQAAKRVWDRL